MKDLTVPSTAATVSTVPLTTVYTPPASCTGLPWTIDGLTTAYAVVSQEAYLYDNYAHTSDPSTWTSCWPPNFFDDLTNGIFYYFSPGICPYGFTTDYMRVTTALRGPAYQDTTFAACCPSGYTNTLTGLVLGGAYCTSSFTTPVVYTTSDVAYPSRGYRTTTLSEGIAFKYRVQVRYQSSDLANFPTDYTLASLSSIPGARMSSTVVSSNHYTTATPTTPASTGSSGSTSVASRHYPGFKLTVLLGVLIPTLLTLVMVV